MLCLRINMLFFLAGLPYFLPQGALLSARSRIHGSFPSVHGRTSRWSPVPPHAPAHPSPMMPLMATYFSSEDKVRPLFSATPGSSPLAPGPASQPVTTLENGSSGRWLTTLPPAMVTWSSLAVETTRLALASRISRGTRGSSQPVHGPTLRRLPVLDANLVNR